MRRDAADQSGYSEPFARDDGETGRGKRRDDGSQLAVLVGEQAQVLLPGARIGAIAREPIRALEREGTALLTADGAAHHILPIGGVHYDLPDVMAAGGGAPGGGNGRETTK